MGSFAGLFRFAQISFKVSEGVFIWLIVESLPYLAQPERGLELLQQVRLVLHSLTQKRYRQIHTNKFAT